MEDSRMKAILVIDMPSDCVKCNQFVLGCCNAMRREIEKECIVQIKKPSWCPLKPLPNKKKLKLKGEGYKTGLRVGIVKGWNAFRKEITNDE